MVRTMLGVVVLLMLVVRTWAEEKTHFPQGPQPTLAIVSISVDEKGMLLFRQTVTAFVAEERVREVEKNGAKFTEKYTVVRPIVQEVTRRLAKDGIQLFGTDGKKMDAKTLPKLLKKKTLVLLSADGQKVDPAWLKIVKPGTLILVLPVATFKDLPVRLIEKKPLPR